ncbi:AraC family transcriptional regulator [Tenggerimyces flavus]|uniref:AraC family transcriptional regulator n=1 Tax=Tenggerimyces flavus TaxID=1708749 RepID=A0ABV7YKW4_9ACTN|nr:AraC family transcriptional regulator [Tenggerimyces flavus]MBM7789716.1 AraC-like DNA-binding protein [Tenggerimyces flavus]
MDVLSPAIAATRTGRPRAFRIEGGERWGRRFDPVAGAAFHTVRLGSCWLISAHDKPLQLAAGDIVLLPHGSGHGLADSPDKALLDLDQVPADSDAPATTVVVSGQYLLDQGRPHPLLSELPETVHLPVGKGALQPQLQGAADLLGRELEDAGQGADAAVPALMDVLLLYILRAWYAQQPCVETEVGWGTALRDPTLSAILAGIHRSPERAWTVDAMAAESGLSRTSFARRFNEVIGQPPLAYLTWWRMMTAARMLRDSDLPLAAVARRVGYSSEFAFANAFKREYGIAPGKYRQAT